MWVVQVVEKWSDFETTRGHEFEGLVPTIGFMPVYETYEDARADYPNPKLKVREIAEVLPEAPRVP